MEIKLKLSKKRIESAREGYAETPLETWRGLRVEYATAAPLFAERCRDLDPAGCVGIIDVTRDSPAWKAGLRPGDFLSHLADKRVTTPREFYDAAGSQTGDVALKLTAIERAKSQRIVSAE
jgi:S1-C subfamily serine protease